MKTFEHVIALTKLTSHSINGGRNIRFVLYDKESLSALVCGKYRTGGCNPDDTFKYTLLNAGYETKRITVIDADEAVIPF